MNKLPKITSVFLNVTNACNLACRYCFVEQHPNFMTFDIAKDAINFLAKNAKVEETVPSITFFGGEPMLCWDDVVKPIIEYVRNELKIPFNFSITTNGILLTEDVLVYLAANNVGMLFSIDGDKATQDYNRPCHNKESSFDLLEAKIPLILKHHPDMTFRSTLIPETCENIFKNIMFAEQCGYTNFFLIPNVFQDWDSSYRKITEDGMRKYSDYFIESCRHDKLPIKCNPLEEALQKILQVNNAIKAGATCGCKTAKEKCGLGASGFGSIDYRGNIYACQEMVSCKGDKDPFYIGDIYAGTKDSLRLELSNSFDSSKLTGGKCETCKLRTICDGGCVANNFMKNGDVNSVPEEYCWWIKLLLDEALYIVDALGNEKNVCFRDYWHTLHGGGCQQCQNKMNH